MKSLSKLPLVVLCPILAFAAFCPRFAFAQNIVEQRIVLNWGVWNWDYYSLHGVFHIGSGVPDGHYYLHLTEHNGTNPFDMPFQIVNGQPVQPEWTWSGYQARFVPDDGWKMVAISASGLDGPAQGIVIPASGENTVWRLDKYFLDGNVPSYVNRDFDFHVYLGGLAPSTPTPPPNCKCTDDKSGGNQENCQSCSGNVGMPRYSVHSLLVSLNVQDTPLRYKPARGPVVDFTVTYNQRDDRQPAVFSYSNLGPKWTFGWLSYVVDNPVSPTAVAEVYLPGGGTEVYPFDSISQTFLPEPQSQALLVRTGSASYEKRFPDGSKQVFSLSTGATTYPRKLFMTQLVDPAGNSVSIAYDSQRRVTAITDALGQITSVSYGIATEPLKITKVTDPFGRFATFEYDSNGRLKLITDEIGIQSQFGYQNETDSICSLTTPYGTTSFVSGGSGSNRWITITDPLGGTERVEYRDGAPGIGSSDSVVPNAGGIVNAGLDTANTFYWDKKAMAVAPGDFTKARIKHWLYESNGSVSGAISSEKQPLENRVWYTYPGQPDYLHVGRSTKPSQVARVLADGTTQLYQYEYNSFGKTTKSIDPAGRTLRYVYDTNQIDLLEMWQVIGTSDELLRRLTYNTLHQPLTDTDAAGQTTTFSYNPSGQILTRTNAKGEITTYSYGGVAPAGCLATITSPSIGGLSVVTRFGYDSFKRQRTVTTDPDQYTVTTDYDNLDRRIRVTYPDTTFEQFQYTDHVTGVMTLDLTGSRDRHGHWTYRHYDANRKLDSITDPLQRVTRLGWCTCGSLTSITDPAGNRTTFNRDLQGRVYQKVFHDRTSIGYLFEGQGAPNTPGATSRLQSATDALLRRTNYSYSVDDNLIQVTYTDSLGHSLNPPTASVGFTYDPNYDRVLTMTDGTGLTTFEYYPVTSSPTLGAGRLKSVDGPMANDTVVFTYDELGRKVSQSVNGEIETGSYDALGRLTATDNALGHFDRQYEKVTSLLRAVVFPNGQRTYYGYYGNDHDERLRMVQNVSAVGAIFSRFDYASDAEGSVTSLSRMQNATSSGLWFDYDDSHQLLSTRNAFEPNLASQKRDYKYDEAGNRRSDSDYDPHPTPPGGWFNGVFANCEVNKLNQITIRTVRINDGAPQQSQLVYDAAGNLVDDGAGTTFEWDAANRLSAINYQSNQRTEFTYDGFGRRVQIVEKSNSDVTNLSQFIWIGNRIAQERSGGGAKTVRKYFAEGERLRTGPSQDAAYFYTRDHLGSIREVTDSSGVVQACYDYDPYGKRTRLFGTLDVSFGYTGHYYHERSGLNLTLHRAYHPTLGRWLSRDPIEERGGLNLYGYVENNPINATDPLGLIKIYGNWCGPDWTGGRSGVYTPHPSGYYRAPINSLDSACETHDICYSECRTDHPCDGGERSQCFRACDRVLTAAANAYGGIWGHVIASTIDRPGKRSPERDDPSCCQKGK
jgi:RHS repeat-associated protein